MPARFAVMLALLGGCSLREDAPPAAVAEASSFPASGMYEVSVRVVADDCAPAYVAPAPWRARVLVQAEGARGKVNLPISALPPDGSTRASSRSDFVLEAGYEVRHRAEPCAGFAIDSTYTLDRFGPEGFALRLDTAYGAGVCESVPTSCSTRIESTYTLVERECAAECTRGRRPVQPGPQVGEVEWAVDCRCPEGS